MMQRHFTSAKRERAMTFGEVSVAVAVFSVLSLVLLTALVSLHRSFSATEDYAENQDLQMRLMDYVAMDIRRAKGEIVITTGTDAAQSGKIALKIPDYYDGEGNPRSPVKVGNTVVYNNNGGSETYIDVEYFMRGTEIIRKVGTDEYVIADNVSNFKPSYPDPDSPPYDEYSEIDGGKSIIVIRTSFIPSFRFLRSASYSSDAYENGTSATTLILRRN